MPEPHPRGRGTAENPPNRFERLSYEFEPECVSEGYGRPTEFFREPSRSIISFNAILTMDAGAAAGYIYEYQRFERPRSFLAPQDLAAIGIGYPLGLGAKLTCPDRPVVTISGDGAFLCNGAELETAIREKLNTVCIILNNHNLGSERAYQRHYYNERYIGDTIGNPRFDEYARSFGAVGFRVEEPGDLDDVFAEAMKQDRPVLVDVICDPDIYPAPRRKDAVKAR
ncbi:thiamine pyrophosphate-dependent enzyme [Nitrospinota bacterium]